MLDHSRSWVFFPDFTAGSPYQSRLAEKLAGHGWAVRAGDITQALQAARAGPAVFHLHWEQPAYLAAEHEAAAAGMAERLLHAIDAFRATGGRLVWTLHNAQPHEERFMAVNLALQRGLARRADLIHAHNHAGAAHAIGLGASPDTVLLARHPSYHETYPDDVSDAAARAYLSLAADDLVFAFFGAMRAYKGLPRLLRAFEAMQPFHPKARLLLAGRPARAEPARFTAPEPALRVMARPIADAEVQYVMRAADCVVLPYEAILTSGALALAQGFGRPVIVPDLPAMREEVREGESGFLFAAGDDHALEAALCRAAAAAGLRDTMRAASRKVVEGRDFAALAAALAAAVGSVLPAARAS